MSQQAPESARELLAGIEAEFAARGEEAIAQLTASSQQRLADFEAEVRAILAPMPDGAAREELRVALERLIARERDGQAIADKAATEAIRSIAQRPLRR